MSVSGLPEEVSDRSGKRPVYSIGAVVKMLGVDATTLRAWEERYAIVVPTRGAGGQRVYSHDELEHLRFVVNAVNEGSSAGDAHRLLSDELQPPAVITSPVTTSQTIVILLAERRDRHAAELFEYLLRTEGYEVCVAFDPGDAEVLHAERHPSLSVVELMISGGGIELCKRLSYEDDAPVLAVSALDLADEALGAGASAFLPKPIDPLQFVSTIRDLLGDSTLTRTTAVHR